MAAAATIACLILSYARFVGYDELNRILTKLAVMIAGMSEFLPAAFLGKCSDNTSKNYNGCRFY
ncbi:hypothetical protein RMSM_03767 [Rhodopirellula maiorica SM1]|uniref:Uncharacterized protein n=1 Tax=Rhodopirellula maiorica SM1 TaxID=1265738 RepID=M5RZH3_9BACT|nr:hypothetical protein RMSM_03767 [Rhodopirellula maiorica SM1]